MASSKKLPLLSFVIVAYNQEMFIGEAVMGAFNQTYSPLEIILSDDYSTDNTFEIMKGLAEGYNGPHKIIIRRNDQNLGLIGHINKVMEIVNGEIIIGAAGDDISLPERSQKTYAKYVEFPDAFCIFARKWIEIDQDGEFSKVARSNLICDSQIDFLYLGKTFHFVPGHSNSWHRSVFDVFKGIDERVISEDIVIPFRAALLGRIVSIDEALVKRRYHASNISKANSKLSFVEKINWEKKHALSNIKNRQGIIHTLIKDIEFYQQRDSKNKNKYYDLTLFLLNYFRDQKYELDYANSDWLNRLKILKLCISNVSIYRILRWVFQYGCPTLYYSIIKSGMLLPLYNYSVRKRFN